MADFSTHDVSRTPTRFGVTPELFKDVVTYAIDSGAKIMTVVDACRPCLINRRVT